MFRVLFLGLLLVFMVGCASVPESLHTQSESPISDFKLIRQNPAMAQGKGSSIGVALLLQFIMKNNVPELRLSACR